MWKTHISWFQNLLQSYSNQGIMILACGRHIGQWNRVESLKINSYVYGQLIPKQSAKWFN